MALTYAKATKLAAKASRKADRKMTPKAHAKAAEAHAVAAKLHKSEGGGKETNLHDQASKLHDQACTAHSTTCQALGGKCDTNVGPLNLKLSWSDEARAASIEARKASQVARHADKSAKELRSVGAANEAAEAHTHAANMHDKALQMYEGKTTPKTFDTYVEHHDAVPAHQERAAKWTAKAEQFKSGSGKPVALKSKGLEGIAFEFPSLALAFEDGEVWRLADETKPGLYRKHILKVGNFTKKSSGLRFQITPADLDHFAKTFDEMKAGGVKVPLPLGHTDDDHKNRGWMVGCERSPDDPRFLDAIVKCDHPQLLKENDCSVFVPPSFTDGEDREWVRPIRHLALTPYPVIPGLGEFQAIAASFEDEPDVTPALELETGEVEEEEEEEDTDLDDQEDSTDLDHLTDLAEDACDLANESDKINDHREAAFACQRVANAASRKGQDNIQTTYELLAKQHADEAGTVLSFEEEQVSPDSKLLQTLTDKLGKPITEADVLKAFKLSDPPDTKVLKLTAKARSQELRALVLSGQATPAQISLLEKTHCGRRAVTLSLSDDPEESILSDAAFKAAVSALSLNPKNSLLAGELSGPQTRMELSNEVTASPENPLLADAEARAEKRK